MIRTLERHRAAVQLGDRAHDRESEPRAPATVAATADEPLEHAPLDLGWDSGPVILHDQRRVAVLGSRLHQDVGTRRGVAQGVLDQVQRQPVQVIPDALHVRRLGMDRELVVERHRPDLGRGIGEDLRQIHPPARLLPSGVGARE